ncbi:MAG: Rrf2 family transcriptional regulator [Clostridiaceae bacterium]|jgi:Rrf2 family protein|nr:Rrf2 family transcriptional regulator [Clostridiaceae bacterium]
MRLSMKCSVAAHCLIFIHEYGASAKVTSELLALSTGIHPVTIRNIVSALKKAGMVEAKPGTGGAILCRSPGEIDLYQVCQTVEPDFLEKLISLHPAPSSFCPVGRSVQKVLSASYEKIRKDLAGSLASVTLADLLEEYHGIQKKEIF